MNVRELNTIYHAPRVPKNYWTLNPLGPTSLLYAANVRLHEAMSNEEQLL